MEKTLIEIAVLLAATKIGGLVSNRFNLPEVLGAMIAGVVLGPIAFNVIDYNYGIELLANLGVITLMFLAGLETNLDDFKTAGKSAFLIAVGGVILPLALGTFSAFLFSSSFIECLFIGVILTATSVSITVQTLMELGKFNTRASTNIVGAAVIDDVLGLILISILLSVSGSTGSSPHGASLLQTLIGVAVFCIIALIAIIFLPKHLNELLRKLPPRHAVLPVVLAGVLGISFIAESLGLASITGAYICGLLLSKSSRKGSLDRNFKAISSGFLAPIFFASIGLTVNIKEFNIDILLLTIVMFIIAVAGKLFGCSIPARLCKLSKKESLQIGIGMISRGEVALITASIGLKSGIISNEVYFPVIIVVILTTIITPVLLKLSFAQKKVDSCPEGL